MPSCAMIARRRACALVKRGIGRDHDQRGVFAGLAFGLEGERLRRHGRGQAVSAEFAVALVRRGPEMRPAADHGGAGGIDHRERADGGAVAGLRRGRADAALQIRGGGAEARADAAEREVGRGAGGAA